MNGVDLALIEGAGWDAVHSWFTAGQPEPANQWLAIWLAQRSEDYGLSEKEIKQIARAFSFLISKWRECRKREAEQ